MERIIYGLSRAVCKGARRALSQKGREEQQHPKTDRTKNNNPYHVFIARIDRMLYSPEQ
jgi:hypothetical protein